MKHPSFLDLGLVLALVGLPNALLGCGNGSKATPQPGAAPSQPSAVTQQQLQEKPPAAAPGQAPPNVPFVAPTAWRSSKGEVVAPPDPAQEQWRVFVNQQRPMQRKTPVWRPLAAAESAVVQMPEVSSYRCIVTPLQIAAEHNDFNTKLLGWTLQRDLLCSADQWRSWTVHPHKVRILPDGTRKTTMAGEVLFSERDPDQQVRETFVLLRDVPERLEAAQDSPERARRRGLTGECSRYSPQQTEVPAWVVPQVWVAPAAMAAKRSAGGDAWPRSSAPQHTAAPRSSSAQLCSPPALTRANSPAGAAD